MKEYSVKFPVPAFTDYPRTVKNTVDWVATNMEVEKPTTPDSYVFGSDLPSPLDNSKIWAHYPNSQELPPVPGQNPNLPTPQLLSYFPGSVKAISTLASIPDPYSVFFDDSTQTLWVANLSAGITNYSPLLKIDSNLNVTSYPISIPQPFSGNLHVTVTPNGRVFLLANFLSEPRLYELVNGSYILRWSGNYPNLPRGRSAGLISDASNNLYLTSEDGGAQVYRLSAPSYNSISNYNTISGLSFMGYPFQAQRITGIRFNSSGDLIVVLSDFSSPTYLGSISGPGDIGSIILGPFNLASFQWANTLALDSLGNYYIARPSLIYKITPAGVLSIETGAITSGYVDGEYSSARFNEPRSIHISSTNNLYVADSINGKIRATSGGTSLYSTVQIPDYIAINSNIPYSLQVSATNSPTSYSATNLPTGLTINTSTGLITGTPTATGVFSSTVRAENSFGGSTKGVIFQVFSALPTNYYNLPTLRRAVGGGWWEFPGLERGDLLLVPSDQEVLFPWGESNKSYDLAIWGEPIFQVPVLPAPPSGFKYKYYIGAKVSSSSGGPIVTP